MGTALRRWALCSLLVVVAPAMAACQSQSDPGSGVDTSSSAAIPQDTSTDKAPADPGQQSSELSQNDASVQASGSVETAVEVEDSFCTGYLAPHADGGTAYMEALLPLAPSDVLADMQLIVERLRAADALNEENDAAVANGAVAPHLAKRLFEILDDEFVDASQRVEDFCRQSGTE